MAYACPRCGGKVSRQTSTAGRAMGGIAGLLIGMAIGGFSCGACGAIPKSEFPEDVQSQMTMGSVGLVGGAIVLIVVVVGVLVAINS